MAIVLLLLPSLDSHLGSFGVTTNYYPVLVHKLKHPFTKCFNRLLSVNLEYINLSDAHLVLTAPIWLLNYTGLF